MNTPLYKPAARDGPHKGIFQFPSHSPGSGVEKRLPFMTFLDFDMDRKEWNETIDWMQKEQGMWELEEKDRNIILNYLSKYQGVDNEKDAKQRVLRKSRMYEFEYRPNPF